MMDPCAILNPCQILLQILMMYLQNKVVLWATVKSQCFRTGLSLWILLLILNGKDAEMIFHMLNFSGLLIFNSTTPRREYRQAA